MVLMLVTRGSTRCASGVVLGGQTRACKSQDCSWCSSPTVSSHHQCPRDLAPIAVSTDSTVLYHGAVREKKKKNPLKPRRHRREKKKTTHQGHNSRFPRDKVEATDI